MTTTCTTPGCDREARTRGMCSMHYARALRAGLPRVGAGSFVRQDHWPLADASRLAVES